MSMVTGLVALAVWGADPVPPPPVPAGDEITCQVEMMTVNGLDWRAAAYAQLKPAARQGTATIWTADRSLKGTLEAAAAVRPSGQAASIKAPRVTTAPGAIATVNSDKIQNYVRHVDRISDGPINGASQVAFRPEVATIREGFNVIFSARAFDQGVMTRVKLAESHIGSLHSIQLGERLNPAPVALPSPITPTEVGRHIVQTVFFSRPTALQTTVQIPEVFLSVIDGEWFVPSDSVLLISMGVNTVADDDGKAVVQERLAILDFASPADEACVAPTALTPACRVDEHTAVALENDANLTMPRVPDRSLPAAFDRDGTAFELPPLPEAYASNDLNQINPGSPLATAQSTPITRPDRTIADPELARTSLEAIPDREIEANAPYLSCNQPTTLATVVESFLRKGISHPTNTVANLFPSLPTGDMVELGPDRQEPFPNRSYPSIETQTDEAPTGRMILQLGAPGQVAPITLPALQRDDADCPAAGCPFSAQGCDGFQPTALAPLSAAKVEMGISVRNGQGTCVYNAEDDLVAALKTPGKTEVKFIPLGNGLSLQIEAKVVGHPATKPAPSPSAVGSKAAQNIFW